MKRIAVSVVLVAIVMLAFNGCPRAGSPVPEARPDPITEPWGVTGSRGGSIAVAVYVLPEHYRSWASNNIVVRNVLTAPIIRRSQATLAHEPGLASSYVIAPDAMSITVTLRPGLKWSDGTTLDANDVVFTATELYQNAAVVSAPIFHGAGGQESTWELIDSLTYRVSTPSPYAAIVDLASIPVAPEHVIRPILDSGASNVDAMWPATTGPEFVGCGPFRIYSPASGGQLVLERNPYYYETDSAGTALPYLDQITLIAGDPPDLLAAGTVEAGPLHWNQADAAPAGVTVHEIGLSPGLEFLTMNQNPIEGDGDKGLEEPAITWLQTKEFRQALAHLMNRSRIISEAYHGHAAPTYTPVHPDSPFYWTGASAASHEYSRTAAADLLDGLGWTDQDGNGIREDDEGNPITLTLRTNAGNEAREAIIGIFAEEAAAVGIEIIPAAIEIEALIERLLSSYDWELIVIGLTLPIDPYPLSGNTLLSSGSLHLSEPLQTSPRWEWEQTIDAAWEAAAGTTNAATRRAHYQTIQEVWIDECPSVYITAAKAYLGASPALGNVSPEYLHAFPGLGWEGIVSRIYLK